MNSTKYNQQKHSVNSIYLCVVPDLKFYLFRNIFLEQVTLNIYIYLSNNYIYLHHI